MFFPKLRGPYILDQASCLALGYGLVVLLLGDFLFFDVPRVGNTIDSPKGNDSWRWPHSPPEPRASSHGDTHKVKLVMKAVLGRSTSKETSLAVSARLTALVVTTL